MTPLHVQKLGVSHYEVSTEHTTLNRRINSLDFHISEALTSSDGPIYVVLDSTCIKVHSSGDWMRRHSKVRKGYLKVHIAVNVKTRDIEAFEVTQEYVHDGTMLEGLVKEPSRRVEVNGVIGDGAYDSRGNFNLLVEKGIEPIIKVRKNVVRKLRGCPARKEP